MNTPDAIVALLKAVPYFAGLSPDALKTLAAGCHSKSFGAGQVVFMEGDPCHHLYILESGRVKFCRMNAEGREQILRVFDRQGDTFCIPSAFSTERYIVNAMAMTGTRLRVLDVDTVICALGTRANPILAQTTPGLAVNRWGYIVADEQTGMTSLPGVFAGGDIVTGAATVILAMGAGRRAAAGILDYLGVTREDRVPEEASCQA